LPSNDKNEFCGTTSIFENIKNVKEFPHLQERLIGLLSVQHQGIQKEVGQARTDPATHLVRLRPTMEFGYPKVNIQKESKKCGKTSSGIFMDFPHLVTIQQNLLITRKHVAGRLV
jgi:hypothetical protein